jgi:predicted Rossmann fold flavoprotein
MYDIITIWWWASGLRTNIWLPKNAKKLILEKTNTFGTKLLLSGGERCNFTNINCNIDNYVGQNKTFLHSIFHKFNNQNMIEWIEKNQIQTKIENNWRVLLKNWKSKELLNLLLEKIKNNNVEIKLNTWITDIKYENNIFTINTNNWEFKSKKVIIATGGKSFPQLWTDGIGFKIADKLNIEFTKPYKWLCGITTTQDLSQLSWSSIISKLKVFDNNKIIYEDNWVILFTHFGLSWPVIFNTILKLWEYFRNKNIDNELEYFQKKLSIKIELTQENTSKRIRKFWNIWKDTKKLEIILNIQDSKSWKEAKIMWWWIKLQELNNNMESKKYPWLYWIWEIVDITGKTWWYNLQWCWSSWFVCAKSIIEEE